MTQPSVNIIGLREALEACPAYLQQKAMRVFRAFILTQDQPNGTPLRVLRPLLANIYHPQIGHHDGFIVNCALVVFEPDQQDATLPIVDSIGVRLFSMRLFGERVLIVESLIDPWVMRVQHPALFE